MAHWPEDLPLPHIYPTQLGMVHAEWSSINVSTSLEIDTIRKTADLLVSQNSSGDIESESSLTLDIVDGWTSLADSVKTFHPISSGF